MKPSNGVFASIVVIGALACAPTAARAGTVSVEQDGAPAISLSVLVFTAAPGEQNEVTVTAPESSPSANPVSVTIRDVGAPLQAGPGCTGGGPAGSTATCTLHPHSPMQVKDCKSARGCPRGIPGTAWDDRMEIELGDGDDSFDGSEAKGASQHQWAETVHGGPGDDRITTGAADDTITPGTGDDTVHAGLGDDQTIADQIPDGNDLLDLGGDSNTVDDSGRAEPLHLADHVLGASGEKDTLQGSSITVIGGSGDDELDTAGETLVGGPGDDTLIGSPGPDTLVGLHGNDTIRGEAGDDFIDGGDGNDLIEGGEGNDVITEVVALANGAPSGDDRIDGGPGNDRVTARTGDDSIQGGSGNDRLYGGAGDDSVDGGAGDDLVAGEEGADTLIGGTGDDRVLAGKSSEESGLRRESPVDDSVDRVDCGPGRDISLANQWDRVANCETRTTIHTVRIVKVGHDTGRGTATVWLDSLAPSPTVLRLFGRGVRADSNRLPTPSFPGWLVRFSVRAKGSALATLRDRGRVKIALRLSSRALRPPMTAERQSLTVVLKKKIVAARQLPGGASWALR